MDKEQLVISPFWFVWIITCILFLGMVMYSKLERKIHVLEDKLSNQIRRIEYKVVSLNYKEKL